MELREKTKEFRGFKAADLVEILQALRDAFPTRKLALFLDNASIHRAAIFTQKAQEVEIELVYNIPYSPQLQGCEACWQRAKHLHQA